LILNTNKTGAIVPIPKGATQYMLTADELLTKKVKLNGEELTLTANNNVPLVKGVKLKPGNLKLPAQSIVFLTFSNL
ncbi:MAG TPA: hypothetical protein VFV68_08955, partial [Agriterribacter sp.]|nr:hypothetical protein [Agriterribacter sp.]